MAALMPRVLAIQLGLQGLSKESMDLMLIIIIIIIISRKNSSQNEFEGPMLEEPALASEHSASLLCCLGIASDQT